MPKSKKRQRRLSDGYSFAGFRAAASVRGVFGYGREGWARRFFENWRASLKLRVVQDPAESGKNLFEDDDINSEKTAKI
jgi:hypothetical protein